MKALLKNTSSLLFSAALLWPILPTHAKNFVYRGEAEVQVSHAEDHLLGLFLAQQVATLRTLKQFESLLATSSFLPQTPISEQERYALSKLLSTSELAYPAHDASNPLFKVKRTYDTLKFPEDYMSYYVSNIGDFGLYAYEYDYRQRLSQDILAYLQRINNVSDPNEIKLLRLTMGKPLFAQVQAERLIQEAEELRDNDKIDRAIQLTEDAISRMPDYVTYRLFHTSLLVQKSRSAKDPRSLDDAIRVVSELIEKYPQDGFMYVVRASLYLYQDVIPEQGLSDAKTAVALASPRNLPAYLVILGILADKNGQTTLSRQSFKKACDLGVVGMCTGAIKGDIEIK